MQPISLSSTGEKKTLIFYTAALPPPAKVTGMDESASQTPPSHSTSSFLVGDTKLSASLPVYNFMCPTFLHSARSSLSIFFLTFFNFHLHHMGIIFLERKDGRGSCRSTSPPQKSHRESKADLNSQPASYTFFNSCLRRTSKTCGRGRALVARWTSEDI